MAGPHNSSGSNNRSLFRWSAPLLCGSLQLLPFYFLFFFFFLFVSRILSGLYFLSSPSSVCGDSASGFLQSDSYIVETYKERFFFLSVAVSFPPSLPFIFASIVRHILLLLPCD